MNQALERLPERHRIALRKALCDAGISEDVLSFRIETNVGGTHFQTNYVTAIWSSTGTRVLDGFEMDDTTWAHRLVVALSRCRAP